MSDQFEPGHVWESGQVVTPSRLNRAVREAARLSGTLKTDMIGDAQVTEPKLADGQVTESKLAAGVAGKFGTRVVMLDPPYERVLDVSATGGWTELDLAAQITAAGVTNPAAAILLLWARATRRGDWVEVKFFVNHEGVGDPDTDVFLGVQASEPRPWESDTRVTAESQAVVTQKLAGGKLYYWREVVGDLDFYRIDLLGFAKQPE